MKSIGVFSMCLNEIHFMELYLKSNLRFADEIVLIDGGSTDGTLDIIEQYRQQYPKTIKYTIMPQSGRPYSADWDTGTRRTWCLNQITSDFAMRLDVDELVDDTFITEIPQILTDAGTTHAIAFNFVYFWRDFYTIRVRCPEATADNAGWDGIRTMIWPHIGKITYPTEWHHAPETGLEQFQLMVRDDISVYHLHYASSKFLKQFDNRRGDINCLDGDYSNPDWEGKHWLSKCNDYWITLKEFTGQHPTILKDEGFL